MLGRVIVAGPRSRGLSISSRCMSTAGLRVEQHEGSSHTPGGSQAFLAVALAGATSLALSSSSKKKRSPAQCEEAHPAVNYDLPPAERVSCKTCGSRQSAQCATQTTAQLLSGKGAEVVVDLGSEKDFDNAELYDVRVFGGKYSVLLTTVAGKWYCTGASCTHYSAPLVKGVMAPDNYADGPSYHVACPWHDAEFDLKTGKCVNGPSLTAIPTFPVEIKNGRVLATLPKDLREEAEPKITKRNPSNTKVLAVIGGGPASMAALETLRQEGYDGRLIFVTMEKYPPYDRPVLSKNLYANIEHIKLRGEQFLKRLDIEFMPETEVTELDSENSTLTFKNGKTLKYDQVLCCAGAEPRVIPIEGHKAPNIFPLRRPEHAEQIQKYAKPGKRIVVVGSSFIGMEVACTLSKKGAKVDVVGMEHVPFERVLGKQVGEIFSRILKANDLGFHGPAIVDKYILDDKGNCKGVQLKDGKVLECDAVVLGAGVMPTVKKFVKGVEFARDGSIICEKNLKVRTGPSNFWAAGDCVTFPWYKTGGDTRIEHWDVAYQQGRIAAQNICGKYAEFNSIPFFWTILFGKSLRYAGHCRGFDYLHVEGDLDGGEFIAYYCQGDEIMAVASCDKDPIAVAVCELMKLGIMPSASDVKSGKITSDDLLNKLKQHNKDGKPALQLVEKKKITETKGEASTTTTTTTNA